MRLTRRFENNPGLTQQQRHCMRQNAPPRLEGAGSQPSEEEPVQAEPETPEVFYWEKMKSGNTSEGIYFFSHKFQVAKDYLREVTGLLNAWNETLLFTNVQ